MSTVRLQLHTGGGLGGASVLVSSDSLWSDVSKTCASAVSGVLQKQCGPGSNVKDCVTFAYLDDESDRVVINSDAEWVEAVRLADIVREVRVLHLEIKTKSACGPAAQRRGGCCAPAPAATASGGCCGESSMDGAAAAAVAAAACSSWRSRDPNLAGRAQYPAAKAESETPLEKVSNPDSSTFQYKEEALRAAVFAVGPIGGGWVSVAGDGGLRQWQLSNVVNHDAHVPNSFFAVRTASTTPSNDTKCVVLQSSTWYDQTGFTPAPTVTDHIVPQASIQLLKDLPGVKTVELTARYPVVEIDYTSGEVPATVHTTVLSPCIGLDSKNSGFPAIFFQFDVTNPGDADLDVSLMMSQQNIGGWDGLSAISNETTNAGYGGNVNSVVTMNGLTAIDMCNPSLQPDDPFNGHVAIACLTQDGDKVSHMLQYESHNTLWQSFEAGALPGQGAVGPSAAGKTWNGALECTRTVAAKATTTITFVLAWHFPNRYVNWSQKGFYIDDTVSKYFLGNQYATVWKSITEVLQYALNNAHPLVQQTIDYRNAMYSTTTLPWQLIDSAAPRITPVRSPTTLWAADGRVYMFEGCSTTNGCCPLNCTHVQNYEMALSRVWPDLEQGMRLNDLELQISPNGIIPSRSTVPQTLRRQWTFWPDYTQRDPDQSICVDGEIGTVLKLYREVLMGVTDDYFKGAWHQCQKIMTRWMTVLDEGDGVVRGPQPTTYDTPVFGANTFIGSLYMAALKASQEMALLAGDSALAATYETRFELSSANYEKECFTNGKWYTQPIPAPPNDKDLMSTSTFVDALLGQWWAYTLGLGAIFPAAHVQSSVTETFNANHVDQFDPARQAPRKFFDSRDAGMYIATWGGPKNPPPPHALLYTSEGAWTGLEYSFGGLAMQAGLVDTAMHILSDTRNKYDGTRRSPWNEIECGDFYTRQGGGFLFFEIASGQFWNAPKQTLSFGPIMTPTNFSGFFTTNGAWGQYQQKAADAAFSSGTATLRVDFGVAKMTVFRVVSSGSAASVKVAGKDVAATVSKVTENGKTYLAMTFASPVSVPPLQSLVATITA